MEHTTSENISTPINAAVFVLSVALIAALLLPRIASQRMAARQTQCTVNMMRIGLGLHNYHSAYKQMPVVCGGTAGETDETGNQGRLGVMVGLLPWVEQQKLWEAISNPYVHEASGQKFPPMGPAPWYNAKIYRPWGQGPALYRCPERADRPADKPKPKILYTLEVDEETGLAVTTNYVVCFGDGVHDVGRPEGINEPHEFLIQARATQRGIFMPGRAMKFRDVLDGLSNTIMMSETKASETPKPGTRIAKNVVGLRADPTACLVAAKDAKTEWWPFGRGSRWCDGALPISGFQTVLPPNSPSCTSDHGMFDAVISASSDHADGVHVLFADGHVSFIDNTIDTGKGGKPVDLLGVGASAPGSQSPFGLWVALGTRASKERFDVNFPHLGSTGRAGQTRLHAKDKYSTWTHKDGKTKLTAKFVRIIDKKTIELEDSAGNLRQVPLNTLDDSDIFRAVALDLKAE